MVMLRPDKEVGTMNAYSMDLRERVAAARDDGMCTGEVAELFGCCTAWVRRLMQGRRERGTLAPLERRPPDQRRLTDADRATLRAMLVKQPDATLAELAAAVGGKVHPGTVCRAVRAMGLPRKKSRSTPPSRTARM